MDDQNLLKEQELGQHEGKRPSGNAWTWFNLMLTLFLLAVGTWYLASRTSANEILNALRSANLVQIILSTGTIILVLALKAWRWQLMFVPRQQAPTYPAAFWALLLGAYVNVLLPVFRLGEVARLFALEKLANIRKAQTLATLVLEKTLDLIFLGLTVAVLVTAVIIPTSLNITSTTLLISTLALLLLLLLYLTAVYTEPIVQLMQAIFSRFPAKLNQRLGQWTQSSLIGLGALRDKQLALLLLGSSLIIAILSVVTPWLLFSALQLPLGWVEAAVLHVAVTIALVPPTTPGKIGIFDGVVAFLLWQFGISDEATIISYTLLYHLVVIVPLIILGSLAAARSNWSMR
jgi:hypothetical protein